MGITNKYEAFCINEVCLFHKNKLSEVDKDNKPIHNIELLDWIDGKKSKQNNNSELIKAFLN